MFPGTLGGICYGRWVQTDLLQSCSMLEDKVGGSFPQYVHKQTEGEECWIRDRLLGNQCINGCHNPAENLCKSTLMKDDFEFRLLSYVWKPYSCALALYTDEMTARCFQARGYAKPVVYGDSISRYFADYVNMGFDALDLAILGEIPVIIDSFCLVWVISHCSEDDLGSTLRGDRDFVFIGDHEQPAMQNPFMHGPNRSFAHSGSTEGILMNTPFLSGEKLRHQIEGRFSLYRDLARLILKQHGCKEVDWGDISMVVRFKSAKYLFIWRCTHCALKRHELY